MAQTEDPAPAPGDETAAMRPAFGPDLIGWGFAVLMLALASGRGWLGLGRDYLEYVDYYQRIPPFFSFQDTRFEPGFHLVAWVFANILGLPFWSFAFAVVLAALAVKAYLFRRYLNYPVAAMVVYLATFYPNQEYTQIRAAAAISFGMLAIHLFFGRRFIIAAAVAAFAFTFHYSIVLLFGGFAVAYALRRNLPSLVAVGMIGVLMAGVMLSGGGLNNVIITWFSTLNPLVGNYVDNIAEINAASIWSVNNLIVIAIFGAAVAGSWLSDSRYRKCFTIMFGLSVVFVIVLGQSPIIAVRAKEMLLVSVVFAAFRYPLGRRDLPAVALIAANAAFLLFLAVREGVILSST